MIEVDIFTGVVPCVGRLLILCAFRERTQVGFELIHSRQRTIRRKGGHLLHKFLQELLNSKAPRSREGGQLTCYLWLKFYVRIHISPFYYNNSSMVTKPKEAS